MTDLQLYIAVGFPPISVLGSLTISLVQISAVREELQEIRTDMRDIRSDMKLLTGKVYEMMGQR